MTMVEHLKQTAAAMTALETGSPEAIADCRRKLREAQKRSLRIVDGPCGPITVTSGHTPEGSAEWAEHDDNRDITGEPV